MEEPMRSEMIVLERANPVPMDAAEAWTESDVAHRAYARLIHTIDHGIGTLEPALPATRARSSWRIAAVAAVAVAVILAVPLALLDQRDGETTAPVSLTPVELGADHVWPDMPREGSPVDLAAAFAGEVLGWVDATTTAFGQADPTGPIWVRIEAPGRPNLEVLTAPTPSGGRVVIQVGSPLSIGADDPDDPEAWWIALQYVDGATSADASIRPVGREQTVMVDVGPAEIKAGRFELLDAVDIRSIGSLLVRYRDAAGNVIAASGGHFATEELPEEETSPQAILSDGVVTEAEYFVAAQAVVGCLRARGVEASFNLDNTWDASFITPDNGGNVEAIFNSCHAEHMGGVELVWADQNAPAPEREIAFYNAVVDCVEAQTGEDYGDMGAVADTKATNAALAAAPDLYTACFDQVIEDYPDLRSGS